MTDNPIVREMRVIRNLILVALVLGTLVGLRQLNTVPYRLQEVYDENNRIETASDLLGSYYRPIRDGEDVGGGVRYHNFEDAKLAQENNASPREIAKEARVRARALAIEGRRQRGEQPFTMTDIKRWLLSSSGVDDDLYSDAQLDAMSDSELRSLMANQAFR